MYKLKNSLIAAAVLVISVVTLAALAPVIGWGQGGAQNVPKHSGLRKFYLTQTEHNGSQALTACESGYHMASMYEVLDPSNLRYDTQLGFTNADSGIGPSTNVGGWIHTGAPEFANDVPGSGNCNAWKSGSDQDDGTFVFLTFEWQENPVVVSPWRAATTVCSANMRVWCVQN